MERNALNRLTAFQIALYKKPAQESPEFILVFANPPRFFSYLFFDGIDARFLFIDSSRLRIHVL